MSPTTLHALIASAREARREAGGDRRPHSPDRSGSRLRALPHLSKTKLDLSAAERTTFHFKAGDLDISADVTRADFEAWIAADIERIGAAIDVALERAGVTVESVDSVFMTGGTSYVPDVRRLFEHRFGQESCVTATPSTRSQSALLPSPKTVFISRMWPNDARKSRDITRSPDVKCCFIPGYLGHIRSKDHTRASISNATTTEKDL